MQKDTSKSQIDTYLSGCDAVDVNCKIILFYVFTPIKDPDAIVMWQRAVCERYRLRGRVLVSVHGINATLGGELKALKRYVKELRSYTPFKCVDIKWSQGTGLDVDGYCIDFPKLSVKHRAEIVSFGAPGEIRVDKNGVIGTGTHIAPSDLHGFLAQNPSAVFFDGRNRAEASIGRFKDAVVTDALTTRDFLPEIESGKFDHLKDQHIITYCTGGIRCEVLSLLLKNRGFRHVYQIKGGIVRYAEKYANKGLWQGSLVVFDKRDSVTFGSVPADIGTCVVCGKGSSTLVDCANVKCQDRLVVCEAHKTGSTIWCATHRL